MKDVRMGKRLGKRFSKRYREQKVRLGNDYSENAKVTNGIPQGSILGPDYLQYS